jgi:hypothetical protein
LICLQDWLKAAGKFFYYWVVEQKNQLCY